MVSAEKISNNCAVDISTGNNYPYIVSSLLPLKVGNHFQSQQFTFCKSNASPTHPPLAIPTSLICRDCNVHLVDLCLVENNTHCRELSSFSSTRQTLINCSAQFWEGPQSCSKHKLTSHPDLTSLDSNRPEQRDGVCNCTQPEDRSKESSY